MNFNNKYKDRNPKETVQIIIDFFTSRGYEIKIINNSKNSSGTWSSQLELRKDNNFILSSNGKGLTEEYSFASGYAELYERFCNKIFWIYNPFICKKVMEYNYLNKGYYLDKNEKVLTPEEAFESSVKINNFYKAYDVNGQCFHIIKEIYNNLFIGVPFTALTEECETKYLDLRLLNTVCTSSGMCAGNTLEEALVQGISELFEHNVCGNFFNEIDKKYFYFDPKKLQNEKLLTLIQNIENNNNKVYILDFSHTRNLPVVAAMIINKTTNNVKFNFGSAPVFDIAVERVITEMYQNRKDIVKDVNNIIIPYRGANYEMVGCWSDNITDAGGFYEDLIWRLKEEDSPNWDVFLPDGNYSNEYLLKHYLDFANNIKFNLWYYNHSLSDNMFAVQCYTDKLGLIANEYLLKNVNILDKLKILNFTKIYYDIINEYILKSNIDFNKLNRLINDFENTPLFIKNYVFTLMGGDFGSLFSNVECNYLLVLSDILSDRFVKCGHIFSILPTNNLIYKHLKKYLTLYRYINNGNYSSLEIKNIMNFLEEDFSILDYSSIKSNEFIAEKAVFSPIKEMYNSNFYKDYLLTLI